MVLNFSRPPVSHRIRPLSPILLTIVTTLALASCLPEPIGLPDIEKEQTRIVVSSLVMPDTSVIVVLTKSVGALEVNEKGDPNEVLSKIAINNADVSITVRDSTYRLNQIQPGVYKTLRIPVVPGLEYRLSVSTRLYGTVSATTIVQPSIQFDTVRLGVPNYVAYETLTPVTYSLSDPPERNFYVINFKSVKKEDLAEQVLHPDGYTRLLDDAQFAGKEFTETFTAVTGSYPRDSVAVSIANVNEKYFSYLKKRVQNELELVEIFSEPVHYETNVEGGLGYFELHLADTRILSTLK